METDKLAFIGEGLQDAGAESRRELRFYLSMRQMASQLIASAFVISSLASLARARLCAFSGSTLPPANPMKNEFLNLPTFMKIHPRIDMVYLACT